jgi:hypothetical protein
MPSDLFYYLALQHAKTLNNEELLNIVRLGESDIRRLVVHEFRGRPCREVFEIAVSLTKEKKATSRESGYQILAQLGYPERLFREESMPVIMDGLKNEKMITVKEAIISAVGHIDPPEIYHEQIIDILLNFMKDKNINKDLKISIAFAIGGLSISPKLVKLIEKILTYKNLDLREWLEISMLGICDRIEPSRDFFEIAKSLIYSKKVVSRDAGYLILGEIGSPKRPFYNEAIPIILHGIETEKSTTVKCAIAFAIGYIIPPENNHEYLIERLLRFLDNKNKLLQIAVAFALKGFSPSPLLDKLIEKLLESGDKDIRIFVNESLNDIRDRETDKEAV